MKKWQEFEDKFNLSMIHKYELIRKGLNQRALKSKEKLIHLFVVIYNYVLPKVLDLKNKIISLSKINPKEALIKLKNFLSLITFKNIFSIIMKPPYKKIGVFIFSQKINLTFFIIFSFSFYKIYQSIQNFYPKDKQSRSISSTDSDLARPSYYLLSNRLIKIENIQIPVALTSEKRIASVAADVVIECPTRSSQQFLYNAPYLIQDKLNNTIAPQINTFPLTEEGKIILRKKIQSEIGELLKENHFKEYKIEKVNIIQVMSS